MSDERVMNVISEPSRTSCEWFFPIGRWASSNDWHSIGTAARSLIDAEASCQYFTGLTEVRFLRVVLPITLPLPEATP